MVEGGNEDLRDFVRSNVAANTKLQSIRVARRFEEFLRSRGEGGRIEDLSPGALNTHLGFFFQKALHEDGKLYEPDSLSTMHRALARYLDEKDYPEDILKGDSFKLSRNVLGMRKKALKKEGKGNKPNRAEALTPEDEERLWETRMLGIEYPGQLLNTMWYLNTKYLGFRGNDESHQLRWGDMTLKKDVRHGEFVEWNERSTKTRQGSGTHLRSFAPKLFKNVDQPSRCPVMVFKTFGSRRPKECLAPDTPFYLAINHNKKEEDPVWYKRQPLGINMLKTMLTRMCAAAGIEGKKTNHSVCRTMINRLKDNGVSDHATASLSGHKSVTSISSYAEPGLDQQHGMASILMGESLHRRLPVIRPAAGYPATGSLVPRPLPSSTVSRPPLAERDANPETAITPSQSAVNVRELTSNQQSALYGMFAGANITGGSFSFTFPKE